VLALLVQTHIELSTVWRIAAGAHRSLLESSDPPVAALAAARICASDA
jgi:hypothetical protein